MIPLHPHAPIGITMGDPAGVGPEIIVKLFAELMRADPDSARGLVVLGDGAVMQRAMQACGITLPIKPVSSSDLRLCWTGYELPLLECCSLLTLPAFGIVSAEAGKAAHDAITTGIDLALAGQLSALVTAPIHKEALKAAGIVEPGHTEILAHRSGSPSFGMMLANDELRVMLVSIHVSLKQAIAAVTQESVIRAIRLADQGTRAFGVAAPRIAVAGLNPHAGEAGQFGREEIDIIEPAVCAARAEGFVVSGPFAPDTIFMRARQGAFDVVVAMYHDQGLIPVKYLGIDHGVNVTVGLPFPRTSVDHGTAFDLAGTGKASAESLGYALRVARRMIARSA
jgi:4-hydroxythreonine-4-phosphate dehydrogenase